MSSSNSGSNRPSAGTPQFQNLSGAIRSGGPPQTGSHRLTSTNYFNNQPSTNSSVLTSSSSTSTSAHSYVSIMQRSISGNNLHSLDGSSTIITNGHQTNSTSHNPPGTGGGPPTKGRTHISGSGSSSSGCSSSSAASQHSNGSGGDPSTVIMNQTPSPSDSAVGDLESMLREKDTEINYLRETMEQNEQVIFKVSSS